MLSGIPHWRTPAPAVGRFPGHRECREVTALERRLDEVIRAWKPDVLHAHSPMLVGLAALGAARRHHLPLVYEVRDLWENAAVDRGKFGHRSPQYYLARALENQVLRHADAVVTLCEALRGALAPRVVNSSRLFVVPNGVDAERFQPGEGPSDLRAQYGLGRRPLLAYAGTFQPYEGLFSLLDALSMVRRQVPDAHLLIAGGPNGEAELREGARARGIAEHVTFTGRLPHERMREVYQTADVLVYPRVLTPTTALTTPLKPLEAMSMGKPVIVSDVAAMQELVSDGVTGRAFEAGSAESLANRCVELLADGALRQRLGAEARRWVLSCRQWPDLLHRYPRIYEQVRNAHAA